MKRVKNNRPLERLIKTAGYAITAGFFTLLGISAFLKFHFALGGAYLVVTIAVYVIIAQLVFVFLPSDQLHKNFGMANVITLNRTIFASLVAGFVVLDKLAPELAWVIVVMVGFNLLLDGVDGRLARHNGTASPFGARFDMEVDAFLILVLCLLLVVQYKMGFWILAIGFMRYVFVGAGWIRAWLREPLPPSTRRKTIGVVQVVTLLISLLPVLAKALQELLLGVALVLLVYSFIIDVLFLRKRSAISQ